MSIIASLLEGRSVVTLTSSASALEAARTMTEARVGALLVTDQESRPSGIFTERDLMTRVVVPGRDPAATPLEAVMTRELFVTAPDARIAAVRLELQRLHIRHVPVVEAGRFVALLSLRDLLRADLEECSLERHKLTEYIQSPP